VLIPLPYIQLNDPAMLSDYFSGYNEIDKFIGILQKYKTSTLRIVDLNYIFNVLLCVAKIQNSLCELADWIGNYFLKVKALNVWRTIPYVDIPEVIQRFDTFGPPMCLDMVATCPNGSDLDAYIEISRAGDPLNENENLLVQALDMFFPFAPIFGIPEWMDHKNKEIEKPYYLALHEAGMRANEVQRKRNEKPNCY
jgi:hypothetical protein